MFKIGKKDEIFKKLEILDLKLEINSVKMLRLEEKVSNFEKRLVNVETSNRKLAEAVMKLAEILKRKEMEEESYHEIVMRRPAQQTYDKRKENVVSRVTRIPLEEQILEHLRNNGPSTPAQMQTTLNRSREHISRTLKVLTENGTVVRKKEGRTFVYSLLPEKREEGLEKTVSSLDESSS